MTSLADLARASAWVVLISFRWAQQALLYPMGQWFMNNVLAVFEEASRSVVREFVLFFKRFFSAASFWVVSVVSGSQFYRENRQNVKRQKAWQGFWSNEPQSTLNTLVDRQTSSQQTPEQNGHAPGASLYAQKTYLECSSMKMRYICCAVNLVQVCS